MRVLIVESDAAVRTPLAEQLVAAGFDVIEAGTGDDALQYLGHTSLDVLFTNTDLPGGSSGWELARIFRNNDPALVVLYATSDFQSQPAVEGSLFVSKPYTPAQAVWGIKGIGWACSSRAETA